MRSFTHSHTLVIAQALQQDSSFRVRALTRNASSAAAKAIADRGIEVVTADLSNRDTLDKVGDTHDLTTALTSTGLRTNSCKPTACRSSVDAPQLMSLIAGFCWSIWSVSGDRSWGWRCRCRIPARQECSRCCQGGAPSCCLCSLLALLCLTVHDDDDADCASR